MDPLVWAIVLLLLGSALLVLELFVPSGGILGCFAVTSLGAAIWVAFTVSSAAGISMLAVVLVMTPILLSVGVRIWPHTPFGRRLLGVQRDSEKEVVSGEMGRKLHDLVGKRGQTRSRLWPSGSVRVAGQNFDATSQGAPIDAEQAVEVVAVRMNRLVVKPSSDASPAVEAETQRDDLSRPIEELGLDPFEDPLG